MTLDAEQREPQSGSTSARPITSDETHAAVLRRLHETLTFQRFGFQSMDCAAIERAVEVLEREAAPVYEGGFQLRPEEISERNRRRNSR